MSKIDELIAELCPDGVEHRSLNEICKTISAGGDLPSNYKKGQSEPTPELPYPIYSNGSNSNALYGFTNSYKISDEAVTISARGTIGYHTVREKNFTPIVRLITLIPKTEVMTIKFLNYALDMTAIGHSGGSIPQLTVPNVKKLTIPVPPLEIQREIVDILDKFTQLEAELEAELEARKKQYEHYRNQLLTFDDAGGVRWTTLGEIGDVTKLAGFEFTKYINYSDTGEVIALRGLNVKNGHLSLDQLKYIDGSDFSKLSRSKLFIGDMLFTYVGTVGQVGYIDEDDRYYLAPNVARVRFDTAVADPKFMIHYFQSEFVRKEIERLQGSSSMKNLTMQNIRKFKIPVPSLSEQNRITTLLDKFDLLTASISQGLPAEINARRKQYEHYRGKLLTFTPLDRTAV